MATIAQTTANQANAQKSTGPTSETGKAASSRNHLRHGFAGRFTLLSVEDPAEYDRMLNSLRADFQPKTNAEDLLVERMTQHQWLVQRALQLQTFCFDGDQSNEDHQRSLSLYIRYQTTNERAFSKCLSDLLKLRSERRKEQIGFESQQLKKDDLARKQQIENRKQDLHQCEIWLAEAKAEHQELLNYRLETPEMGLPNRVQRILARQQAA